MTPGPFYRLTGLAVIGFILLFIYALVQLVEIQQTMHTGVAKSSVWNISQAERELRRLDLALGKTSADLSNPTALPALSERLDILYSRIALLNDGPQRAHFALFGLVDILETNVEAMRRLVAELEPQIDAGRVSPERARAMIAGMEEGLARFANGAMLAEVDEDDFRRRSQRNALTLAIAALTGLMLTGSFLIWRLVDSMRAAVSSGKALAEHKLRLEATVEERTAALSAALETERTANDIYRSFITTVSHQFRTPLSIIDMVAQSFIRRPEAFPPEAVAEKAQRIRNASSRLLRLLESTTHAARLDIGAVPVELSDQDLARIVENACLYQREIAPEHLVAIHAAGAEFPCRADPALIEQVVINLLSNAAKYSPPQAVIRVELAADENHVACAVIDDGIGIPEADREKIFTRFFRASNAAHIPGTGLGLNLSRAIAGLHGGSLDFDRTENGGTVFTLKLPRRKDA